MAEYIVDPDNEFARAIKKALKKVDDLTIPFGLIAKSWFKGNNFIFDPSRQGPGQYVDLSPRYKKLKSKAIGSPYPILRGFTGNKKDGYRKSGKLAKSMTDASNPDAVNYIINKQTLILGTKVEANGKPYARFLNFGTKDMPARPLILIGGEETAPFQLKNRRKNWIELVADYVEQVSKLELS